MEYLSPIGPRRVRTDLRTADNVFVSPNRLSANSLQKQRISSALATNTKTIKSDERSSNRLQKFNMQKLNM